MLMLIIREYYIRASESHFNTSHVNVNPGQVAASFLSFWHFNTSHVNVNRNKFVSMRFTTRISIHLMLMLIVKEIAELVDDSADFNTSHVNVNPTNLSLFNHA